MNKYDADYDNYNDNEYISQLLNRHTKNKIDKRTDDDKLEEFDIKTIENFLRKKKLKNIKK